jgi:gliding motility-associated lipoprotein GldH
MRLNAQSQISFSRFNMCKNFICFIPFLFNFIKTRGVIKSFLLLFIVVGISSCNWTTGVFEKNLEFKDHEWLSTVKPDIAFIITDTVSLYNIYIVMRHTDAYHFNNMYVRVTVNEPGEVQGRTGDYDLQLATNGKGWIGTAMDDTYDARMLIQPKTRFRKTGTYHITLEQLMREDPLKNVLSAGLRVERIQ